MARSAAEINWQSSIEHYWTYLKLYRQVIGKEVVKRSENVVIAFAVEYQAGVFWDKSVCKQPSLLIALVFEAISNVIFYLIV